MTLSLRHPTLNVSFVTCADVTLQFFNLVSDQPLLLGGDAFTLTPLFSRFKLARSVPSCVSLCCVGPGTITPYRIRVCIVVGAHWRTDARLRGGSHAISASSIYLAQAHELFRSRLVLSPYRTEFMGISRPVEFMVRLMPVCLTSGRFHLLSRCPGPIGLLFPVSVGISAHLYFTPTGILASYSSNSIHLCHHLVTFVIRRCCSLDHVPRYSTRFKPC